MENIIQVPPVPPERQAAAVFAAVKAHPRLHLGYFEDLAQQIQHTGGFATYQSDHPTLYLNNQTAIRHVLQNYSKKETPAEFLPFISRGLLLSDNPRWERQREIMAPAFQPKRTRAAMIHEMNAAVDEVITDWRPRAARGEDFDFTTESLRLTFGILVRALFHETAQHLGPKMQDALTTILMEAAKRAFRPDREPAEEVYKRSPFKEARAALQAAAQEMVGNRRDALRANPNHPHKDDVLSLSIKAYDGDPSPDAQEILVEEMVTLLLAGHETTAYAISGGLKLLSQNPNVWRELKESVDAELGNEPVTIDNIGKLTYARDVVLETLRLLPSVPLIKRVASKDDNIPLDDGRFIAVPKGQHILISSWTIHRAPNLWPKPNDFDPKRFVHRRDLSPQKTDGSYIPFAQGGPRICIGAGFAMDEATTFFAKTARNFDRIIIPDAEEITPIWALTLRTDRNIIGQMTPRGTLMTCDS